MSATSTDDAIRQLQSLRDRFDSLGNGRFRPGEIHPGVTMNLDQAIEALKSGLDPAGRSIAPAQVGHGLERLADYIDTPEWGNLADAVTPPDQQNLLQTYVFDLRVIAKGVAANGAPLEASELRAPDRTQPPTPAAAPATTVAMPDATDAAAPLATTPPQPEQGALTATRCPKCHAVFQIRPDALGKTTSCKRCRHNFTITLHEGSVRAGGQVGARPAVQSVAHKLSFDTSAGTAQHAGATARSSHSTVPHGSQHSDLTGRSRLRRIITGRRGLLCLAGLLILLGGGSFSAFLLTAPTILDCVVHEHAAVDSDGKTVSTSITLMVKTPCSDDEVLDAQDFSLVASDRRTVVSDSIVRLAAGKVSLLDRQDEFSDQSRALIQFKLPSDLAADSTLWLKHGWRQARQLPESRKHTQSTMRFNTAGAQSVNRNAGRVSDTHAPDERRREDLAFLMSRDWIVGQAAGEGFLRAGISIRFSPDGKMTDWFRSADLGTFVIDPSQTPKHIDLTIRGETRGGVCELVAGDVPQVHVCMPAKQSDPRPDSVEDPWNDLASKAGQERAARVHYAVLSPVEKQRDATQAAQSATSKGTKPDKRPEGAPASKPSPPAPARPAPNPAELITGKWSGKYPVKNVRGEVEILDETWEFQKDGAFRRVIMLGGATATREGTYRVVDAMSLELDERAARKLVWKMTLTPDTLVITHPTKPEPGSVGGAGTSTLQRTKDSPRAVAPPPSVPKEYQGKWKLDRIEWAEADSKTMLAVSSPDWVRTIAGNRLTEVITDEDGSKREEYTITIDTTTVPHRYTMVATFGDKKETIGIISATKDELRMCFQKQGRPKDFTITQGQSVKDKHVYRFKRQ